LKKYGHKTIAELRASEREIHKMNALQGNTDEQNRIIHQRAQRRRAQDAKRKAAKRAENRISQPEELLSKAGIEAQIRSNFEREYPDPKLAKHQDKFFRFVHLVLHEHQRQQEPDSVFVQLKAKIIAAYVGSNQPFPYALVLER
jgi:hypothetical protein